MAEKYRRYDITIVKKISENEFKVYQVYPNEDNDLKPVVWEGGHYLDGCMSLHDYIDSESKAYIDEDYNSLEEVFNSFSGEYSFYNSEFEVEQKAKHLSIDQNAVFIYFEVV